MASRTNQRLTQIIKERTANVILHELSDPRCGFVTVTNVDLARDLSTARIFYSVMGTDAERNKTTAALQKACAFIQRRVGETLRTRVIPHFIFEYDPSVVGAAKMGALLHQLAAERGPDPEGVVETAEDAAETAEDTAEGEDEAAGEEPEESS